MFFSDVNHIYFCKQTNVLGLFTDPMNVTEEKSICRDNIIEQKQKPNSI